MECRDINIDIKHDGNFGYDYTVSCTGVLLTKGWIRCELHRDAIVLVRTISAEIMRLNPPIHCAIY